MIASVDKDGDSQLSLNEFSTLMRNAILADEARAIWTTGCDAGKRGSSFA